MGEATRAGPLRAADPLRYHPSWTAAPGKSPSSAAVAAMPHDVFISYSQEDQKPAEAACAELESRGFKCWIAPRDILPGSSYLEALYDAINSSRLMVLVYSAHSNSSHFVPLEVNRAHSRDIPILVLRLEASPMSKELEMLLSLPQWLDATSVPIETAVRKLGDAVETRFAAIPTGASDGGGREGLLTRATTPDSASGAQRVQAPQGTRRRGRAAAVIVIAVLAIAAVVAVLLIPPGPLSQVAASSIVTGSPPVFHWPGVDGAHMYELEIKRSDTALTQPAHTENNHTTLTFSDPIPRGVHKWRVRARAGGAYGPWSDWQKLTVN